MNCTASVGTICSKRAIPPAPYRGKRADLQDSCQPGCAPLARSNSLKEGDLVSFSQENFAALENCQPRQWETAHDSQSDSDFSGFQWIDPPKGHFWADPFAFEHNGRCWAFFEDYSYQAKRGAIACSEVSPQGELGSPVPCLDHPSHHYSYPHIFRAGSEIFMIPESVDSNSVDLLRCQQFPDKWVREAVLLEGKFRRLRFGSTRDFGGSRPQVPSQNRAPAVSCCFIRHRSPAIGIFIREIPSPRTSKETAAPAVSF